jgi:hypothetical protein
VLGIMGRLSHNFFFALLISFGIIAVVTLLLIVGAGVCHLVSEAFNIFPYHTVFAIVVFWVWFAHRIMPTIRDDDNDF